MRDVYSALFLFSAISAASVLVGLLFYILIAVAAWRIMVKAGEPGWKGIIPVYNIYSLYKISWKTNMFWALLVLELLSSIIQSASDGFLLSFVGWICSVAGLVIGIMGLHKVSKAFGHGLGFTPGPHLPQSHLPAHPGLRQLPVSRKPQLAQPGTVLSEKTTSSFAKKKRSP